jgi:hypothetical protein
MGIRTGIRTGICTCRRPLRKSSFRRKQPELEKSCVISFSQGPINVVREEEAEDHTVFYFAKKPEYVLLPVYASRGLLPPPPLLT